MVEILRNIDKSRIEPILILLYSCDHSPYKRFLPKDLEIIVIERRANSNLERIALE